MAAHSLRILMEMGGRWIAFPPVVFYNCGRPEQIDVLAVRRCPVLKSIR